MKKTLALVVVLVATAACSSEATDDAEFADPAASGAGTAAPQLSTSKPEAKDACEVGATQKCALGTQSCVRLPGSGEFVATGWGPCEPTSQSPGPAPEPAPAPAPDAPRKVNLNVDGDCVCAPACPADVPFIVGCKIDFQGGNTNGCVAPAKNGRIYFQEGVKCDAGHLTGFVLCSSVAGGALDQNNCPINKSNPHFGSKPSECPDIESGTPDGCFF